MKNINDSYRSDSLIQPEDLEVIDDELYEPKLDELVARQAFDLKTNDPEWVESIGYDKEDGQGYMSTGTDSYDGPAKVMHTMADDIPLSEMGTTRSTQDVYNFAMGFRLTEDELRQARATNTSIDTMKATKTRRILAELEANIAWYGYSSVITGAFGVSGITTVDLSGGGNYTGNWDGQSETSGGSIAADVNYLADEIDSNDGLEADTLIVSPTIDSYFKNKWLSSNYNRTVLDAVQDRIDTYIVTSTLQSPTTGGSSSAGELMVLDSDSTNVQLALPMDRTREEPYQTSPYKTIIPFRERSAGVLVRFPSAIVSAYKVKTA